LHFDCRGAPVVQTDVETRGSPPLAPPRCSVEKFSLPYLGRRQYAWPFARPHAREQASYKDLEERYLSSKTYGAGLFGSTAAAAPTNGKTLARAWTAMTRPELLTPP